MTTARILADAERALADAQRAYLQAWGWRETCQTPGGFWMWQRDFADYDATFDAWYARHPDMKRPAPTGTLTLPMDMALGMTRRCLDGHSSGEPA